MRDNKVQFFVDINCYLEAGSTMALSNVFSSSALSKSMLPPCSRFISASCSFRNAEEPTHSYDNNKLNIRDFKSRNPRNLELLRIAYKPAGYALDKPGREFWNKLVISFSRHSVRGQILHNSGLIVATASSAEWGIKKQLYRYSDSCAFKAVGAVLSARAQECGIYEVYSDYAVEEGTKLDTFLKAFESGGVALTEKERFLKPSIFDKVQQTPPWDDLKIM